MTLLRRDASPGPWVLAALCLFIVVGFLAPSPGLAQFMPGSAGGESVGIEETARQLGTLTPAERDALLARLSDAQVRELLLYSMQQAQPGVATTPQGTMRERIDAEIATVRTNFGLRMAEISNLPTVLPFALEKLSEGRSEGHIFIVLGGLALMFAAGAAAEFGFRRLARTYRPAAAATGPLTVEAKLGRTASGAVGDFLALLAFALGGLVVFVLLYQGHEPSRAMVETYFGAVLIVRLATLVSRALFSPGRAEARLIGLDDKTASLCHRGIFGFAAIAAFGFLTCALMQFLGMSQFLHDLLQLMVSLVFIAMIVVTIWRARQGVASLIRGGAEQVAAEAEQTGEAQQADMEGRLARLFADTWHLFAIVYVLAISFFAIFDSLAGRPVGLGVAIASLFILIAIPLLIGMLSYLVERYLLSRTNKQGERVASGFEPVINRALRIVVILLGILVLAEMWGADLWSLTQNDVTAIATRIVLEIGVTLLVAYVAWALINAAVERRIAAEGGGEAVEQGGEGGGAGASRLRTLLPLFQRFLQVVILVLAVMIVLSTLGVEIGPLIAGAGVIGIAIGFGAQTLVRDVVSGVFFLMDDAFRLGEYVDIGSVMGEVEAINVRSLVLRHHRGPLHTVPYGEIQYLTNYSRDWAIMKLEFRVTYDTDMMKVKKIIKQIGQELLEHEELGPYFLEPLKSQGVKAMEDSAMVIRAKFTAKPGTQFMIRKEVYNRIQKAFNEHGIEFAHRRVTVDLPPGFDADTPEGKHLADAAAAALASEQEEQPPKAAAGGPGS